MRLTLPRSTVIGYVRRQRALVDAILVVSTYNVAFRVAVIGARRATEGRNPFGAESAQWVASHAVRFASAAALYRACVRFGR